MKPQPSEKWLRGKLALLEITLPLPSSQIPKSVVPSALSLGKALSPTPHLAEEPTVEGGPIVVCS